MSISKRNPKSQEQKASEDVIRGWLIVVVLGVTLGLLAGSIGHNHSINHNASVQAVDQVGGAK